VVNRLPASVAMLCSAGLLLAAGCMNTVSAEKFQTTQRELQLTQEKNKQLENQLAEEQQAVRTLQAQVAQLRGLGDKEAIEQLVTPVRLEFARLSGGYDTDGKAGDDGIVLFVQPIDRDGHVIKAAGSLTVTILDPLEPPNRNVVARYNFTPKAARKLWYGRLMTNHFSIRCPWPTGQLPIHNELTAYVVFVDLLTGRQITAQKAFKVSLPILPQKN